MRSNVRKLAAISEKPSRSIIGLMSGTSLDGLDVALCDVTGTGSGTSVVLREFRTIPYPAEVKDNIRRVFARDTIDFQYLTMLHPYIALLHAEYVRQCLEEWEVSADEIDLVASHGQTVMHAPCSLQQEEGYSNATLQIGDGDHLAVDTGILTLSDFRQKHVAAGGEGAPLAMYGDYFLFSSPTEDRFLLNCGGIANYTFLPRSLDATKAFATDTGPGNTLVDAFTQQYFPGNDYDHDANYARTGVVDETLLKALKCHEYFSLPGPKTTGPELFSKDYVVQVMKQVRTEELDPHDLLATLVRFSAETVCEDILVTAKTEGLPSATVYLSGGGMHNPLLLEHFKELLPFTFSKVDSLGIPGDAKEAVLFAVLANECLTGEGVDFGSRASVPSVSMGKISFPS